MVQFKLGWNSLRLSCFFGESHWVSVEIAKCMHMALERFISSTMSRHTLFIPIYTSSHFIHCECGRAHTLLLSNLLACNCAHVKYWRVKVCLFEFTTCPFPTHTIPICRYLVNPWCILYPVPMPKWPKYVVSYVYGWKKEKLIQYIISHAMSPHRVTE
jgi:hypothetical protein